MAEKEINPTAIAWTEFLAQARHAISRAGGKAGRRREWIESACRTRFAELCAKHEPSIARDVLLSELAGIIAKEVEK